MGRTITVRLTEKLAAWLERTTARRQDMPVRDPSEPTLKEGEAQSFLRLAGTVDGPEDLSIRKGFPRS
ncbi:MAG: hypothetical protein ABUT39_03730 [Acidobacteriota bacterium]